MPPGPYGYDPGVPPGPYGYDPGVPPGPYGYHPGVPPAAGWGPWGPPPPAGGAGPGTFWPTTTAWMDLDPARPSRWGIPDAVGGVAFFLLGGLVTTVAAVAVLVLATGRSLNAVGRADAGVLGIVGLLGSWAAAVGWLVLMSRVKGQGSLRRDFGFRFSPWDPLIGAGVAFVTLMASSLVQSVVADLLGSRPASNADAIFGGVKSNPALLIAMALLASVGAPLVEELLFRGLALRAIEKRFGGLAGVLGSSLLFGLLHWQPGGDAQLVLIAGISVYGLVFALVTRWWRRLGPSIFGHLWINSLATFSVLALALAH